MKATRSRRSASRSAMGHRPDGARRDRRRGLILVACVGILGVISIMGLAFATVMRLESRAAYNYTASVKAEFAARGGLEDAIARLRIMAREGSELPFLVKNPDTGDPWPDGVGRPAQWYTWRGTAGGALKTSYGTNKRSNWLDDDEDGELDEPDETGECSYAGSLGDRGFYTLRIEDAASKINVNVGDNLGTILDNLCRVIGAPLHAADQKAVMPKWFTDLSQNSPYHRQVRGMNIDDRIGVYDLFYRLGPDDRPKCKNYVDVGGSVVGSDEPLFGDGYAIAGYRARHGEFLALEDVRNALTWIERGDGDNDGDDPDMDGQKEPEPDMQEELLEIEAKFAAIKPYLTIDSWNDTDQIGYGKFELIRTRPSDDQDKLFWAYELTDRNASWNIMRNEMDAGWIPATNTIDGTTYAGELKDCYVAIISGVGEYQVKTIAANTTDTIILSESYKAGSEMRVPPTQHSSYIILGRDGALDEDWKEQLKSYSRKPLSFHRAPVNINTASGKVLTALLMGLQTTWGQAGYLAQLPPTAAIRDMGGWAGNSTEWADAMWQCPSIISLGRDTYNAFLVFDRFCPNDSGFEHADRNQEDHGHGENVESCFFCSYGHLNDRTSGRSSAGRLNEAHYLAWQILKEREQTEANDLGRVDEDGMITANGYGPFRGWDDIFYRVFFPHEKAIIDELHFEPQKWTIEMGSAAASTTSSVTKLKHRHPGISRLCMANFNSNTGLLKFQPNLEYIDRWGPNFTDLYVPRPKFLEDVEDADITLRVRPGELLDKTDLNIGTTEFCFDSGGIYDIVSTGRIYDNAHTVTAERKLRVLVKVYDAWRESTQREFAAGIIDPARGDPGTRQAGQYTLDGSMEPEPRDFRKALATYPEALVSRGHIVGKVHGPASVARLAYDSYAQNSIQPAGYDGQILLATNMYHDPKAGVLDPDITFYNSFTGDIIADASRGDSRPGFSVPNGAVAAFAADISYCKLDLVSIIGMLDSPVVDLRQTREYPERAFHPTQNPVVEGSGVGGDARPDGMHMGTCGQRYMDGWFEFNRTDNWNTEEGAVTMWLKPQWHHGTVTCASLPVDYGIFDADERGSISVMPNPADFGPDECDDLDDAASVALWENYWQVPPDTYKFSRTDKSGRSKRGAEARGYVRDRFEYQLFNGTNFMSSKFASMEHFNKTGDRSGDDGDFMGTHMRGLAGHAVLQRTAECTSGAGGEGGTYVPGHLAADGHPFYQIAPFRWTFIGSAWDWDVFSTDGDLEQWIPYGVDAAWDAAHPYTFLTSDHDFGHDSAHYRQEATNTTHRNGGQPLCQPTLCGDLQPGSPNNSDKMSGIHEFCPPGTVQLNQLGCGGWGCNVTEGGQGNIGKPHEVPFPETDQGWLHKVPWGHTKDRTADHHVGYICMARAFCDGMRTWNKRKATGKGPSNVMDDGALYDVRSPNYSNYDIEDYFFEQYSSWVNPFGQESVNDIWTGHDFKSFGINRSTVLLEDAWGSVCDYQGAFSGTMGVIDEYTMYNSSENKNHMHDPDWAQKERTKAGRYYFPLNLARPILNQIDGEEEPAFTSQNMLQSEQSQSYAFDPGEEECEIEVCTVRWTAFTPFYCIDKGAFEVSGSGDEWRFPFHRYFNSADGYSRFEQNYRDVASPAQISLFYRSTLEGNPKGRFTNTKDYSQKIRDDISEHGVASRYSSQRGCKVKIYARDEAGGRVWFPRDRGDFYEHPEGGYEDPDDIGCTQDGWQQILLDTKSETRQHPKCKPGDLQYKVFFRLSDLEYEEMRNDALRAQIYHQAALVDSPVFDDITITYMRRPKVLEWRDVSE